MTSNWYKNNNHPEPKKIKVYAATSFGADNPENIQILEYDPPGEEDLMRYRMNRIWSKNPSNVSVDYIQGDAPYKISETAANNTDPYSIEAAPNRQGSQGFFDYPRTEKIVIEYNQQFIDPIGQNGTPSIQKAQNKWVLSLADDNKYSAVRNATDPQPLPRNGILGVFEKLLTPDFNPLEFNDCTFEYEVPLEKKKVGDNFYGSLSVSLANIKPVYNFYAESYESVLVDENENLQPPESLLPNLYSFLSAVDNEDNMITRLSNGQVDPLSVDTVFEKHITLNNLIDETRVATQVAYSAGGRSQTDIAEVSKGQYFDKYSYAWADFVKSPNRSRLQAAKFQRLVNKFSNQIVPMSNINLFSDFNPVANRFPMYCEINFSTQKNNDDVLKAFEDADLVSTLIKDYVDGNLGSERMMNFNFVVSGNLPFIPNPESYSDYSYRPIGETANSIVPSSSLKTYELENWLDNVQNPNNNESNNYVILGQYDLDQQNAQANSLTKQIMTRVFKAKMKQLVLTKTRTWAEIVGGKFNGNTIDKKLSYNETLFYKVEKWTVKADGTPDQNIQNFYFPNSKSIDEHHFTDTQVKYGKKYIYRIYAMQIVFGTRYKYELDAAPDGQPGSFEADYNIFENQARICVLTDPYIKLVETPYYQKQIVMMDSPPVFPDIEFVTYRGVRDKIRFWLRGNAGEYKLNPVIIQDQDLSMINSIRVAQELDQFEPITFKSDDQARYFEVYRIDKKPSRYSDFKNNRMAFIDTRKNISKYCKSATGGEFIDSNFEVNKKYYYMFRTIDVHGHFSNPSPVYELEMVYDGYAPFLLSNVYMLEENMSPPKMVAKKFTKYIHLKPSTSQQVVDEVASGLLDENGNQLVSGPNALTNKFPNGNGIVLGTNDQSVWNKKMKVRIISKKTGKRVDLNVKFIKKHIELVESDENKIC